MQVEHVHDHTHEHVQDVHLQDSNLLMMKLIAIVVMIVVTLCCSGLPYWLNRWFRWTKKQKNGLPCSSPGVQYALYFGGGVLLCTTFLHILPEVIESSVHLKAIGALPEYPFAIAPLLMCIGFFLMCLIDEIMHCIVHRQQAKQNQKATVAATAAVTVTGTGTSTGAVNGIPMSPKHSLERCTPHNLVSMDVEAELHEHQHHHHLPITTEHASNASQSLRGLGIIVALSMHELFEGIAIGLQATINEVWTMFFAISAHKLVLAFCVGMELLIARTRTRLAIVYLFTFAIMTPIGIGVGIGISENQLNDEPSLISCLLQGIACGTLLYVIFFEILSRNQSGWRAYLAALVGFSVMFAIEIYGNSSHQHNHGDHAAAHAGHSHRNHNDSLHEHSHESGHAHGAPVYT